MRAPEGIRAVKPGVLYRYAIENELWKSCFILRVQHCALSNAAEDFVIFACTTQFSKITPIVKISNRLTCIQDKQTSKILE